MTLEQILNEFEKNIEQLSPEQTTTSVKRYVIEQIGLIRTVNELNKPLSRTRTK